MQTNHRNHTPPPDAIDRTIYAAVALFALLGLIISIWAAIDICRAAWRHSYHTDPLTAAPKVLTQEALLRANYARGIYANELADAPDTP